MIRLCSPEDFEDIYTIINDASQAYKGIIPEDRWHEPYMPKDELEHQIMDGVVFWGYEEENKLIGVMGIQHKDDVALIRHAYVRTSDKNKGIGGKLLTHLCLLTNKKILVGTWTSAVWAIDFYKKYLFDLVTYEEKERLLRKYWSIPERQVEESVVLVYEE